MRLAYLKSALASVAFLLSLGVIVAYGQPASPVIVTNKPGNPVPVAGEVNIGTMPTVRLDPNANTVKVERRENVQRVQTVNWTGQGEDAVTTNSTDLFSKVRVCIAHAAPNPIQVNVFSLLIDTFDPPSSAFFTYDAFVISTPSTVCRNYDLPGASVQVKISNTGNNNTGLSRFGIVFGN